MLFASKEAQRKVRLTGNESNELLEVPGSASRATLGGPEHGTFCQGHKPRASVCAVPLHLEAFARRGDEAFRVAESATA